MNENKNYLASNIKYLRIRKNITQKQIGKFCNKSDVAVYYWESGSREPNSIDLVKLSVLFNVSVDDLISKDLRIEQKIDEIEILFNKYKNLLNEEDKDMIKFIIEKRKNEKKENQEKKVML